MKYNSGRLLFAVDLAGTLLFGIEARHRGHGGIGALLWPSPGQRLAALESADS